MKTKFPVLPAVIVVALVVGIVAVMMTLRPAELDPKTSCPKSGAESVTVVIVDTSDPLARHQQTALRRLADFLTDSRATVHDMYVSRGHLLTIYEVGSPEPKRLFHHCNPGDPETRSTGKKLTEGKILAQTRWRQFKVALENAFPDVTRTAPQTPLIETIRFVRHAEFPPASVLRSGGVRAGRIIIISDMLQHTDQLSHFGARLPPAADAAKTYSLDLRGIDIHLRYLRVDRYRQYQQGARPHFTWWRKFFAATGSPLKHAPEAW